MSTLRRLFRSFPQGRDAASSDEDIPVIPFSQSPFKLHVADAWPVGAEGGAHKVQLPSLPRSISTVSDIPKLVDVPGPGGSAPSAPEVGRLPSTSDSSGPPAWLGIFFDLAWTATFSNLTSNTELTKLSALLSYAVFFGLAWWLWVAQVTYDSKYFRNDCWHRGMLLVQLTIFGSLSAFTKDFNPFSKHVDPHKSALEDYLPDQYNRKSMLGISGLFACARFCLVVSYLRVLHYLPKQESMRKQRQHLLIRIYSYMASCGLFTLAFVVVKLDRGAFAMPEKLFLWFSAVVIEVVSYLTVPDVDPELLVNEDSMGERLSTLTSIILGEGLNGLAGILVLGANAIGFNASTGGVAASSCVVITFAFLLYFDDFKRRNLSTHPRSRWNVMLHFPLHLALIVLLEALKNNLIYSSLFGTLTAAGDRINPRGNESSDDSTTAAFRNVGLDLGKIFDSTENAIDAQNMSLTEDQKVNEMVNIALAQLFLSVLNSMNLADDVRQNFTDYITNVGGAALTDNLTAGNFSLFDVVDTQIQDIQVSAMWILLASAVFLAFLGFITLANSWIPKCGHVWWSILSRWTMALLVGLLSLLARNPAKWEEMQDKALLGLVAAVAFVVQFIADHAIIWLAARRQRVRRALRESSLAP